MRYLKLAHEIVSLRFTKQTEITNRIITEIVHLQQLLFYP